MEPSRLSPCKKTLLLTPRALAAEMPPQIGRQADSSHSTLYISQDKYQPTFTTKCINYFLLEPSKNPPLRPLLPHGMAGHKHGMTFQIKPLCRF